MKKLISSLTWSSVNPDQVSATVTGAIIWASAAIVWFASAHGLSITSTDVSEQAATIGQMLGLLWAAFGLIRKFIVWIEAKINPADAIPTVTNVTIAKETV